MFFYFFLLYYEIEEHDIVREKLSLYCSFFQVNAETLTNIFN